VTGTRPTGSQAAIGPLAPAGLTSGPAEPRVAARPRTAVESRGGTELYVGAPEDAPVRVSIAPCMSALALVTDALGGRRRGAPETVRRQIRAAVAPAHARAAGPLTAPGRSVAPDCVTPLNAVLETSVDEQAARWRDLSAGDLLTDLETTFGGEPPAHWRGVAQQPVRWLHAYAGAMTDAWAVTKPLWRRAGALLDREIERVGTAVVRGRLDLLLSGLHPHCRFGDGVLTIRDPEPARYELAGRPLVLVPMLSGRDALICSLDRPDAVWLAYPVPGADRLLAGAGVPDRGDSLELLLGPVRARVLTALARPRTMGELAGLTGLAPSAITYHCRRLTSAGLLERERCGREVRVARTERAEQLADLLADRAV
jgi:DNA-binding transcriptional ArsR family regulator